MMDEDYLREISGPYLRTEAEIRKFEADKAIKEHDKPHPYCPWTSRNGTRKEFLHPIIITSSSGPGPFTSPEKVQRLQVFRRSQK